MVPDLQNGVDDTYIDIPANVSPSVTKLIQNKLKYLMLRSE